MIFNENSLFSFRKLITLSVIFAFTAAQIGYLIAHNFDSLPASYLAIDSGVILFYFTKKALENLKISNKKTEKQ